MFKTTQRCLDLLSTLSSLKNKEEYVDTLMDLIIQLKSLVERSIKAGSLSEDSLMCCHQITTCLKFIQSPSVDGPSEVHNYFATRIRFCLTELQNSQENDTPGVPDSVLTALDMAVDFLGSSESGQEAAVDDLVDAIDRMLSQVLLFRTVILPEDQTKLLDMCRVVLAKKLHLKEANTTTIKSLIVDDLKISVLELEQLINNCVLRLFVTVMVALDDGPLASAECTFVESDFDLLMDRLIQLGIIAIGFTESGSVKLNLRSAVASLESLDLHLVPAVLLLKQQQLQEQTEQQQPPSSLTDDSSAPEDTLRRTLVRHWREETAKLSINIHKIIDTKALAGCLIEWISEQLNRNEAQARSGGDQEKGEQKKKILGTSGVDSLDGIRKMFLVFHQHLCLNGIGGSTDEGDGTGASIVADDGAVARTTGQDFLLRHHRKDMKIMLSECKAVLKYADHVEMPRIFKRFRLLLHILEKIRRDLPSEEGTEHDNDVEVVAGERGAQNSTLKPPKRDRTTHVDGLQHVSTLGVGVDAVHGVDEEARLDYEGATEYFMSFGISMAATSRLFYRKQVKKSELRRCLSPAANQCNPSMLPQLSTVLRNHSHASHWQRTQRPHRLFRTTTASAAELSVDSSLLMPPPPPPTTLQAPTPGNVNGPTTKQQQLAMTADAEESLQLNITEILEQLTKFSETFSE